LDKAYEKFVIRKEGSTKQRKRIKKSYDAEAQLLEVGITLFHGFAYVNVHPGRGLYIPRLRTEIIMRFLKILPYLLFRTFWIAPKIFEIVIFEHQEGGNTIR